MSQPYVGEIRMFAGNFAPVGWMFCEGQLLPISENETLFQLIGTTYGGDGQSTFALPNLSSRIPIHMGTGPGGSSWQIGEMAGMEEVTLTVPQIPSHVHAHATNANAMNTSPLGKLVADTGSTHIYRDGAAADLASPDATASAGGGQPHTNLMPYLCVNFIISMFGIFPSQT